MFVDIHSFKNINEELSILRIKHIYMYLTIDNKDDKAVSCKHRSYDFLRFRAITKNNPSETHHNHIKNTKP